MIVDDHQLFADAVRSALESRGIEVLGVALTGEEGVEMAARERPDVVLVDLGLPDASGIEVGRRILECSPDTNAIAVTALREAGALKEAIHAGFHGYVSKDTSISRLIAAIDAVLGGQVVVPQGLGRAVGGGRSSEEIDAELLAAQLTPREKQVLALLVEGLAGPDIARKLTLSPNTVRTHIQSVLVKLQVHSRLEAAAFAVRFGILEGPARRS